MTGLHINQIAQNENPEIKSDSYAFKAHPGASPFSEKINLRLGAALKRRYLRRSLKNRREKCARILFIAPIGKLKFSPRL